MQDVKLRLDAWRDALHRRDRLPPGSPGWQETDVEVRRAETAYRAEVAQVAARYSEAAFQRHKARFSGSVASATRSSLSLDGASRHERRNRCVASETSTVDCNKRSTSAARTCRLTTHPIGAAAGDAQRS